MSLSGGRREGGWYDTTRKLTNRHRLRMRIEVPHLYSAFTQELRFDAMLQFRDSARLPQLKELLNNEEALSVRTRLWPELVDNRASPIPQSKAMLESRVAAVVGSSAP